MALHFLGGTSFLPLIGSAGLSFDPPDLGTGGPDTLEVQGTFRLVFGRGGDDTITTAATPGGVWGNTLFGGVGNDNLTAVGDRNLVFGEGGDDLISLRGPYRAQGGVENGLLNTAFGGSGDDVINSYGFANTIHGDAGNDRLSLDGYPGNGGFAYGDDGNDVLQNVTSGGVLNGGAGSDILTGYSFSFAPGNGAGTVMTGGADADQFNVFGNSAPVVRYDDDRMLGRGDEVFGQFSVITDLAPEDNVYLGNGLLSTDRYTGEIPIQPRDAVDSISLVPILPRGSFAELRGELYNPGSFAIREDGPDLLLLYVDRYIGRPGGEGPELQPATTALALLEYQGDTVPLGDSVFG
jgi:Ca2+-binding RTX toxin-like protein